MVFVLNVMLQKPLLVLRQKKEKAEKLRQEKEKQLDDSNSAQKHAASKLKSIEKRITLENEKLDNVSDILTQKTSQLESLNRLIAMAQERLDKDKEKTAMSPIKNQDESQMRIINERIKDLELEVQSRQQSADKISKVVSEYSEMRSKINSIISQQLKSRPALRMTMQTSHKSIEEFTKELAGLRSLEESAKKAHDKANSKFQELLAKKRSEAAKKAAAMRKAAKDAKAKAQAKAVKAKAKAAKPKAQTKVAKPKAQARTVKAKAAKPKTKAARPKAQTRAAKTRSQASKIIRK